MFFSVFFNWPGFLWVLRYDFKPQPDHKIYRSTGNFNPLTIALGFYVNNDKLFMFVDAYIIRKALQKGKNTCAYLSGDQQNKILTA